MAVNYYDDLVANGWQPRTEKGRKNAAARDAAHFGHCAAFAIQVVIERSTDPSDPNYGRCIPMFEDDAYKAAVRAARIARMRIDMDPLTVPQHRMLAVIAAKTGPDGWADWTDVYNAWDPGNVPVQFAGKAAAACWKVLASRNLVETVYARPDLVRVVPTKGA